VNYFSGARIRVYRIAQERKIAARRGFGKGKMLLTAKKLQTALKDIRTSCGVTDMSCGLDFLHVRREGNPGLLRIDIVFTT